MPSAIKIENQMPPKAAVKQTSVGVSKVPIADIELHNTVS